MNIASNPSATTGGRRFTKYVAAFLAGSSCALICFLFSVYPGTLRVYVYLPLAILLALLGMLFSYLYPKERWRLWIGLVLPYVLLMTFIVMGTKSYNARWEGVFWRSEIYWSTLYLFICPIISSLLGPLLGLAHRFIFALVLVGVLGVALKCQMYITNNSIIAVSTNGSIEIASDTSKLRIDFPCKYDKSINYLSFTYYESGGCGGNSKVIVIRKHPTYGLTKDAVWVIDGEEKPVQMRPIPGGGDVALHNDFAPHQYDAVRKWSTDIPVVAIAKAQDVQFRWGDIQIQLQRDQIEALLRTAMEFENAFRSAR